MLGILLAVAVAGGAIFAYKHYASAATIAAVKAEIAKIETEAKAEYATVAAAAKLDVAAVITRLKALLQKV